MPFSVPLCSIYTCSIILVTLIFSCNSAYNTVNQIVGQLHKFEFNKPERDAGLSTITLEFACQINQRPIEFKVGGFYCLTQPLLTTVSKKFSENLLHSKVCISKSNLLKNYRLPLEFLPTSCYWFSFTHLSRVGSEKLWKFWKINHKIAHFPIFPAHTVENDTVSTHLIVSPSLIFSMHFYELAWTFRKRILMNILLHLFQSLNILYFKITHP